MRISPILFNTDMVRAILREENPKTATRRPIKQRQIIGIGCDECPNNLPEEYIKAKRLLFKPYCDMASVVEEFFNKTWFLTKKQAETALKKMESDVDGRYNTV